ncbi:protein of unknown function DUF4283 - like 5 [Theobroma cacao]|nr:protein of unknown function DUF4283 - like 5 [Theobroma cacao]
MHNNPSFKDVLLKSTKDTRLSEGDLFSDEDMASEHADTTGGEVENEDELEDDSEDFWEETVDGFPTLEISDKKYEKLVKRWNKFVIVRMLGRPISYRLLCDRIAYIWNPKGKYSIVDLDDDCFLVKFTEEEDYLRALLYGP